MNQITIIAPTIAMTEVVLFDTYQYTNVTVLGDFLSEGEFVNVYIVAGTKLLTLTDEDGNVKIIGDNGTALVSSLTLVGGPTYGFIKTETAVPCAVYVNPGGRVY